MWDLRHYRLLAQCNAPERRLAGTGVQEWWEWILATRAPIYPDQNPVSGKPRQKCTQCHKVVFAEEWEAQRAVEKIGARCPMTAYFSGACGWWHLSRIKTGRSRTGA